MGYPQSTALRGLIHETSVPTGSAWRYPYPDCTSPPTARAEYPAPGCGTLMGTAATALVVVIAEMNTQVTKTWEG